MYYEVTGTSQLSETAYERLLEELPPKRRESTQKLLFARDRYASASAWVLLRHALMFEHGIDPNTLELAKGPCGKPSFTPENGIHFNISHSRDAVMCALADTPVGCDVQAYEEIPLSDSNLEQHVLCANEQAFLNALQGSERQRALTLFWVAKESLTKQIGCGLTTNIQKFDFSHPLQQYLTENPPTNTPFVFEKPERHNTLHDGKSERNRSKNNSRDTPLSMKACGTSEKSYLRSNPFVFSAYDLTFSLYEKAAAAFCACSPHSLAHGPASAFPYELP